MVGEEIINLRAPYQSCLLVGEVYLTLLQATAGPVVTGEDQDVGYHPAYYDTKSESEKFHLNQRNVALAMA